MYRKIALFSLFQGRGATEKIPKIAKKGRKFALLSLYLLYKMKIQGEPRPPLPSAADAHDYQWPTLCTDLQHNKTLGLKPQKCYNRLLTHIDLSRQFNPR